MIKSSDAEEIRRGEKLPTKLDVEIGQLIRLRRTQLGRTQSALATSVGISFQQLQKYESGKNRVGAGRLQSIALELGVPITYFFSGAPDQNLMTNPGSIDLLIAYSRLDDAALCNALVRFVQDLANAALERKGIRFAPSRVDGLDSEEEFEDDFD